MRRNNRLVYGMGINDSDYFVHKKENGKRVWRCPYYRKWESMLRRAYSDKFKQRSPTYQGVTVCAEWHSFMSFRSWMEAQDWEGKELDKDILFQGNKVYSPDTCAFVDGAVNLFLAENAAIRGELPIGVSWHKRDKKFMSRCRSPFTQKQEHLGYFHCPEQAHQVWKKRKHELASQLADLQADQRVAEALRKRYI